MRDALSLNPRPAASVAALHGDVEFGVERSGADVTLMRA
jgi:hypothetical protein